MAIPSVLARGADLLRDFPARWAVCGGWAVDAWLDRVTRIHGDLDLTVWHHDQLVVFEHFRDGWLLNGHDADDDDGTAPWTGRTLGFPSHIHAYSDAGDNLDVQLNRLVHGSWVFSSKAGITMPVERCFGMSPWGLPTVTPPVVLFYKAMGSIRPHDETDFRSLSPLLSPDERSWLADALAARRPGHAWLTALSPELTDQS